MIMETVNRGILDYVPERHMGKERWKEFHAEGPHPWLYLTLDGPSIYKMSCFSLHKVLVIALNSALLCK